MNDGRRCPKCGREVPAGSPEGACPRCLLAGGLADEDLGVEEIREIFPAYEIVDLLGRGGMGVVYRARQASLDREVALKVLPPEAADRPGFAERFRREAKAMAKLDHPNVVGVYDFGETEGLFWLAMEYVDGVNLRQLMKEGLEPRQALAIVPQICDALQYAHDRGIVHRDIKPENILVDRDGRVKITDFGLAKLVETDPADLSLTGTGQVMGTVHYMAPEQYRTPRDVDHRADIYSLGVVFYEMLTGDLPMGKFGPPSERVQVDVRLDRVVLRALEREKERRYQRASEVKTEVDAIGRGPAPAEAAPAPRPPRRRPPPEPREPARTSKLAILAALAVPVSVLLAFLGATAIATWSDAPQGYYGAGLVTVAVLGFGIIGGLVLSIVALVRTGGSHGRLRGTGLAVTGLVLSLVLGFLAPLSWLLVSGEATPPERYELLDGKPFPEVGRAEPPAVGPMPSPAPMTLERQVVLLTGTLSANRVPEGWFDTATAASLRDRIAGGVAGVSSTTKPDEGLAQLVLKGPDGGIVAVVTYEDGRWRVGGEEDAWK